jgi:hypothetical protein
MSKYRSAAGAASGDRVATLPLRRVPASGAIAGIITTRDVREVWTHYHRGRTVGCSRPNCPGCIAHCPMRYEAYVGLYSPITKRHIILGLTVGAVRQIVDQVGRLDCIRGLCISAARASKRPNARVVVETSAMVADMSALPASFEVLEHLARIWGVEAAEDARETTVGDVWQRKFELDAAKEAAQLADDVRWGLAHLPPADELDGQQYFFGT